MSAICLIDTSIFVEILNVPNMASSREEVVKELEAKIERRESLFLPMATIIETGNHIARNGDGQQRRRCAERFVEQVDKALKGESPFKPVAFLSQEQLRNWLSEFPDSAMRGTGLGDLSIIHDFHRVCSQNLGRKVYIWSLDDHLLGFQCDPRI